MKLLFLDFDGVINSTQHLIDMSNEYEDVGEWIKKGNSAVQWWAKALDPELVEKVNVILERTGAVVVISSSWRIGRSVSYLKAILKEVGFRGKIIGKTRYKLGGARAQEISDFLSPRIDKVTAYVVLDDDWDAEIPGHFVQTSMETGLTDEGVKKAVDILGEVSSNK